MALKIVYDGHFVPVSVGGIGAANTDTRFIFYPRDYDPLAPAQMDIDLPKPPLLPLRCVTLVCDEDGRVLVGPQQLWRGRPRVLQGGGSRC